VIVVFYFIGTCNVLRLLSASRWSLVLAYSLTLEDGNSTFSEKPIFIPVHYRQLRANHFV
jgi:hypothetical protein